jgi:aspartyl/glutamyl-tRNA(Asn/Gln) amidotransferase C subunit
MDDLALTEEKTRSLAALARLHLEENEVQTFTRQLKQVLEHFEVLQEFSTLIPATGAPSEGMRLREDRSCDFPVNDVGQSRVLGAAPVISEGCFSVPQVISSGESE